MKAISAILKTFLNTEIVEQQATYSTRNNEAVSRKALPTTLKTFLNKAPEIIENQAADSTRNKLFESLIQQ